MMSYNDNDYIGTMVMMVINHDHDNDGKFGDGKQIPTICALPLFTVPVILIMVILVIILVAHTGGDDHC